MSSNFTMGTTAKARAARAARLAEDAACMAEAKALYEREKRRRALVATVVCALAVFSAVFALALHVPV